MCALEITEQQRSTDTSSVHSHLFTDKEGKYYPPVTWEACAPSSGNSQASGEHAAGLAQHKQIARFQTPALMPHQLSLCLRFGLKFLCTC